MNNSNISRRSFLHTGAVSAAAAGLLSGNGQLGGAEPQKLAEYKMNAPFICVTCGTQYAETEGAPRECLVCLDERQYVGLGGQKWTTLDEMRRGEWRNVVREQEANLIGIGTEPKFGIGQRALLVRAPGGNILWDCISFLDDATIRSVRELGGISAIAISHPHYYSTAVEWSRAFGNIPVHLHEDDRRWMQRPDPCIRFWSGETKVLADGFTLVRTGGHFEGFQVLHWRDGFEGRGVLLAGDQPQVCADARWVSFMWSYPNFIPLSAPEIQRIVDTLEPYPFQRLYGAFWPGVVKEDAKAAVRRSAERYVRRMSSRPEV